jgi:putative DNA methylase
MALIRAGFEIRSSAPVHTEAESSLNIRGLDAARSTVLLLCMPSEETEQPVGNWGTVQNRIARVARGAAERFQKQGLTGTDLYLSALGPALGEVGRNWPVTDFAGRQIDLGEALDEAYKAVGRWRLEHIFADLTLTADLTDVEEGFSVDAVDRDTQTLWLWLDTFQGETAHSDDVRKLAKSLNVDPNDFKRMGLLSTEKETFVLRPPQTVDLRLLARRLRGEEAPRGRGAREADVWEERTFPGFVGAAAWNAIALMMGADGEHRGVEAVRRWLRESGYGTQREFRGAFAVTLHLLELVFARRLEGNEWHEATRQARRTWDLVLQTWHT